MLGNHLDCFTVAQDGEASIPVADPGLRSDDSDANDSNRENFDASRWTNDTRLFSLSWGQVPPESASPHFPTPSVDIARPEGLDPTPMDQPQPLTRPNPSCPDPSCLPCLHLLRGQHLGSPSGGSRCDEWETSPQGSVPLRWWRGQLIKGSKLTRPYVLQPDGELCPQRKSSVVRPECHQLEGREVHQWTLRTGQI